MTTPWNSSTLPPSGVGPSMGLLAATPVGGFALVNGTPNIFTWTAPSDGKLHRISLFGGMDVISATTGGQVQLTCVLPDGTSGNPTIFAASQGAGFSFAVDDFSGIIGAGTTVTLAQVNAMTAGSAKLWAELWGS